MSKTLKNIIILILVITSFFSASLLSAEKKILPKKTEAAETKKNASKENNLPKKTIAKKNPSLPQKAEPKKAAEKTIKNPQTKSEKNQSENVKTKDQELIQKTDSTKEKPEDKKTAPKKLTEAQMKLEKKRAEWVERTLDFGIQKERKVAINSILKLKTDEMKKKLGLKLVELIKHEPDSSTKTKAITIISELGIKEAVPVLTNLIDDETEDVRVAATYALKELDGISAKEKLANKLKSQDLTVDSNLNEALITALGHFKAAELVPFAKEQIESYKTTKICRQALVLFLGKTESKEASDFLVKLYENEEEDLNIRAYAVNSLAKLQSKDTTDVIKKMLKEIDSYSFKKKKRYYSLYIYSVAALVKLGDNEAVPRLMASLKSNNAGVRLKSVTLLRELKDKRTIDILKYKMKYDPDSRVQREAKLALKDMGVEVEEDKKEKEEEKDTFETEKTKQEKEEEKETPDNE